MRARCTISLLSLLAWVGACAGPPEPCLGASGCPRGTECLAARCVLEGSSPVDPRTARVLLNAQQIAVAQRHAPSGVGPSVTLGSGSASPAALYVSFPHTWRPGDVHAAFLLLDPSDGAPGGPDLELEVWRASRAWTGPGFAWSDQPGFAPPFARAIARSAPPLPVRIDVTDLVRFVADHPARDHGFALRARTNAGPGVTLSTGLDGGLPPRLDVYLARPEAK